MKKVINILLFLLILISLNGCDRLECEEWGLGKNETAHVSLSRDYDWYIDQKNTSDYSYYNCGPSCAVMAAKWADKDFPLSVEDARKTYYNADNGFEWYLSSIKYFLFINDIPNVLKYNISHEAVIECLDEGNIIIICYNTKDISYNHEPEQRTGKFYRGHFGHFMILKGYRIVDNKTFYEVYDPNSLNRFYADNTPKGKDRYYLSDEVIKAARNWDPNYIVVSPKTTPDSDEKG